MSTLDALFPEHESYRESCCEAASPSSPASPRADALLLQTTVDVPGSSIMDLEAQLAVEKGKAKRAHRLSVGKPKGRFYTEEAMQKRSELMDHPDIVSVLDLLWFCANTDASDAIIDRDEYVVMHRKITLSLAAADVTPKEVARMADEDWERDSQGKAGLDRARFYWTWFELADMYTKSLEAEDYVDFLGGMLQKIVVHAAEGSPSPYAWKKDREIIEEYLRPRHEPSDCF